MDDKNTKELIEIVVNEYLTNNVSIKNLSKKYNISVNIITKELKTRNIPIGQEKRKILHKQRKLELYKEFEKAIPTYLECKSIEKTCKIFNFPTRSLFSKYLKEQGIEVKNYHNIVDLDEHVFDIIDNEEKAYWLGFLYADGGVTKTNKRSRLELTLKESDYNHIEKFKRFLKSTNKIQYKQCKLGNAYRLIVSSVILVDALIKKGCTPRKSLTLTFPKEGIIPNELIRHFMRGYFEGDGWLGFNTKHDHHRCSIVGTKDFINGFCDVIGIKCEKFKSQGRAFGYEFKRAEVRKLLKFMYEDCTIYLDRKYSRYLEINYKNY